MNLKNQPPVFVPFEFQSEIEQLSKAALMDMVWDFAAQCSGNPDSPDAAMAEFRTRREIVLTHRKQAKDTSSGPGRNNDAADILLAAGLRELPSDNGTRIFSFE